MKGLKRRNLDVPIKQAKAMTPEVLTLLRELLKKPTLVIWRTVWCLHAEFELMLRFDDLKRLKVIKKLHYTINFLIIDVISDTQPQL